MAPLQILETRSADFPARFDALLRRRAAALTRADAVVSEILADVRERGDEAVIDATERYDGYRPKPDELLVAPGEISDAGARLAPDDRAALELAAERIRRFHAAHVPRSWRVERDGEVLGQELRPLQCVGLYVPAFKAPLPSSVLMMGIPASVAGVRELIVSTPGRETHPAILYAAGLCGVARVARAGGAQAIGALAYGTRSIPRVDKIVGPGNVYVQAAKRLVYGQVDVDAEKGPSEVLIVADRSAAPDFVAADLLAQAEHDELASVVLASPDAALVASAVSALEVQLADLPRASIARQALAGQSAAVVTRDLDEALELANRFAPEHLQLMVERPETWLERVQHAGAVFLGPTSPVPVGDYVAGPSHVLPTGGTARFFSALGVEDFLRRMSVIQLDAAALQKTGPHAVRLAQLEGLEGHARSVRLRLSRLVSR